MSLLFHKMQIGSCTLQDEILAQHRNQTLFTFLTHLLPFPWPRSLGSSPTKILAFTGFSLLFCLCEIFFFQFHNLGGNTAANIQMLYQSIFFSQFLPRTKFFKIGINFVDNMWHLLMVLIFTFCVFMRLYQFLHIYCQFVFLWKIVHFFYF